ncbi:aldehyde dehydrogenase family protein [Erysipelothrix urinaevulpis]|uniref:aldehyde dehydrogenase family protein n=1 Tax=Erysipelothrix urinaevulpis TaxID=2683717 RepID=UPI00135CA21B|nr:aldehyde dehydrogenase family protein [Erysipelothrix urinaevulpis]
MNKPKLNIAKQYELYINGEWQQPSDGEYFKSFSPSDGEELAKIAQASQADVDDAVQSAKAAFPKWKAVSPSERAKILHKIADVMEENTDHLALVETMDNGKPIRETSAMDVPLAIEHFRYFAGVIRAEEGSAVMLNEDTLSLILHEPLGVVGQIIPWNFPLLMAAWKLAPALATGNTIVLKPSSATSLSALELVRLIDEADILPKGVLNLITGSGSKSGQYILEHEGIQKLSFTGSTEVGYQVAKAAADKLIPATLELGGKSANIIFPDANMDLAIEGVLIGILFNQGQVCCAGSRVFVHEDIYEEFLQKAAQEFETVKVGMPWDPETQMGAQVSENQMNKVLRYIELGIEEGAVVTTGGNRLEGGVMDQGFFTAPTMLSNVTNEMTVAQEEIFGPVVVVIKFSDEDEVIKMANDSDYGLGGGVWTQDINRAIRVSRAIETGRMWVNTYNTVPEGAPFGGYKKSGIGRETHKSMIAHYTQQKNIIINLKETKTGLY